MNENRIMPAVIAALVAVALLFACEVRAGALPPGFTCEHLDHAANVLLAAVISVPAECEPGAPGCIAENLMAARAEELLEAILKVRMENCSEA